MLNLLIFINYDGTIWVMHNYEIKRIGNRSDPAPKSSN